MTTDLIFSELATNFSKRLSSLKRSNLTISNRLKSIVEDSSFVCEVADAYDLPLVANERCGSWYIPPEKKAGSAYFKSTDGHTGQWSFSSRRLNVHVLDLVSEHHGCVEVWWLRYCVLNSNRCIIVDSTRRGKCRFTLTSGRQMLTAAAMPDALSKTVPIWCTVMNMALFPENPECYELYVPPQVISRSEKAQIEDRLPSFVRQLYDLRVDISTIKRKVSKPLRPIWVTRDSLLPEEVPRSDTFYPLILCTSSRQVIGSEMSEGGYIQGAGDDSESWSLGLDPPTFWKYCNMILQTSEDELPDLIQRLVDKEKHSQPLSKFVSLTSAPKLLFGSMGNLNKLPLLDNDVLISCGPNVNHPLLSNNRHLPLKCREKKLGSRDLRTQLPRLLTFLSAFDTVDKVYVACPDGKDLSVGIGLAIICLFFDEEGQFVPSKQVIHSPDITKPFIRQRLAWISTSIPQANPSRTTLQSVNDFLFSSKSSLNIDEQSKPRNFC
jgi:tRNA A64-2'-O-ribosylphosphate transferase